MDEMKLDCVIGIDPGAQGGIAVFIPGRHERVIKMPKDDETLRDFLLYYKNNYNPVVFLEKLSVRPDDVRVEEGRPAMGKLYRIQKMMANYEHLRALLEVEGIPYAMVHPMTWQTKLGLRQHNPQAPEDKHDRKLRYRNYAGRLYPFAKITLWSADALLLMHFGRWALVNDPDWVRNNIPSEEYKKLF